MARKTLRIGFIGAGGVTRWARIPPMKADGRVQLAAVCDPNEKQARETVEKWGSEVPAYTDYRAMIRKEEMDAVFVSTPHSMHFSQTKFALQNGLHALVEKPLTIFPAHARSLIQLAEKQGLVLHVGYQRHHRAPFVYARELITRGKIGRITGVSAYVTQRWNISGWRMDRALSGGGFMMDTGSHLIAVILWLTGLHPAKISASVSSDGSPIDRNAVVQIAFKDGVLGTLAFFGGTKDHDEIISIHGTEGCIAFHQHDWKLVSARLGNVPLTVPPRLVDETPDAVFYRAIRTGRNSASARIAVDVAQLTDAAYRSAEQSRTITVRG